MPTCLRGVLSGPKLLHECCCTYMRFTVCRLDQPVTLCWRLERGPGGSGGPDTLQYEARRWSHCSCCCSVCPCGALACNALSRRHLHLRQRLHSTPSQHSKLTAQVVAEGEGWQPRTWRPGSVGLPAAAGASATVEASWLPTAPGPGVSRSGSCS